MLLLPHTNMSFPVLEMVNAQATLEGTKESTQVT